jgi:hypothetical protein
MNLRAGEVVSVRVEKVRIFNALAGILRERARGDSERVMAVSGEKPPKSRQLGVFERSGLSWREKTLQDK